MQSGSVFNGVFEARLWRRLAANLHSVPHSHVDYAALSSEDLQAYADAGDAEWLQPPWEWVRGQRLVRGSRQPFVADAQGKPRTRYEALFDLRHEFDEIRQGFLFEISSRNDMDLLQDALGREENLNLEARDLDTLMPSAPTRGVL